MYFDLFGGSEAPYYTTSTSYLTSNIDIYSINYYDDYDFDDTGGDEVSFTAPTVITVMYSTQYPYVLGKTELSRRCLEMASSVRVVMAR